LRTTPAKQLEIIN